jgi:heterodisulfide reductase subunit D
MADTAARGSRPPASIVKELDACLQCGYCRNVCPVFEQSSWESASPRGKVFMLKQMDRRSLMDRVLSLLGRDVRVSDDFVERIYWCTSCGMCEQACHVEIPFPELWEDVKAWLVERGMAPLDKHRAFLTRVESVMNPYDEPPAERGAWAKGLELSERPEVIYFVGCTESYRMQRIALATARVLQAAGVPFNIMGGEEWCCTSPLLRTGQRSLTRSFAQHTKEQMDLSGTKVMLTACAGCAVTIKRDHTKAIGDLGYRVMHVTEYVEELVRQGRLPLSRPVRRRVTYHDPCHLGRHAKVFDAPRNIMRAIPGIELVEMPRNRERSRCCGAGAGFKAQFNESAEAIAADRVKEAEGVGAEQIITTCPFCAVNLNAGAKLAGIKLETIDLMQLLLEALGPAG